MKRLNRNIVMVIMVAVLLLTACGTSDKNDTNEGNNTGKERSENGVKVGYSQHSSAVSYRIKQSESIQNEAEERGYDLIFTNAQDDTARQTSDVEDMVAQNVDYIAMSPRDYEGASAALDAAKDADIPVILIDRLAAGEPGEDYVTALLANSILEGEQAGEWVVGATDGKANVVELTGTTGSSAANDRSEGFHNSIEGHSDVKVIVSQTADFSRLKGQEVMENIIESHGDQIDVVYAHNDEMAIGAINALKSAGYKVGEDVLIIGIDGQKDAFELIQAGEYNATVFSSPYFGPTLFDVIDDLEADKEVEAEVYMEGLVIDKTNVEEKMDIAY